MFTKIKDFVKKYWLFILLATIASSLIAFRLIRGETPPPDQATPAPTVRLEQPEFTGLLIPADNQLKIEKFSFPAELEVYQGQRQAISPERAKNVAANLGFSGEPQKSDDVLSGPAYSWSTDSKYLSVTPGVNKIDFGLDLYQAPVTEEGSLPTPSEARESLESVLERLNLTPQFEVKWQKETYLIQGFYFQPTADPKKADFIKVGFNPALGDYQLVSLNPHEPVVWATLGKNQELVRFFWQVAFENFEKQERFTLKTEKEIRKALTTEGVIVWAEAQENVGPEPEIIQARFTRIRLAYFQEPQKDNLIQPIFILSGRGTLSEGKTTEIIAYLPAVSSQFLKIPQKHFEVEVPLEEGFGF